MSGQEGNLFVNAVVCYELIYADTFFLALRCASGIQRRRGQRNSSTRNFNTSAQTKIPERFIIFALVFFYFDAFVFLACAQTNFYSHLAMVR